ncbi:thioredoxin family protein [Streptomyces sp. NPDC048606]|uniref:thioredoxin family protein n=1 Tax=Streptomyces sp. NPDC048606 TaxID=3154726 RepID=UPI0034276D5C
MLRSVRAAGRTPSDRPAGAFGRRLPLVAAAVVVAGMTAACGPSSEPAGSAAPAGARPSPSASASASPETSATPSTLPSASVSASASASASASGPASGAASPSASRTAKGTGSGSGSGSGSSGSGGGGTGTKPAPTTASPGRAHVPGPGYDASADARAQIDAALRAAKSDGRMVLLDFGANWCGNCKAADKVFAQAQTSAILGDSYHLVKVDIGGDSSANSALLRKYSPSGGTYTMPVLVVVSPSGVTRTDTHVTGNPSLTAEGINAFLRKWAP